MAKAKLWPSAFKKGNFKRRSKRGLIDEALADESWSSKYQMDTYTTSSKELSLPPPATVNSTFVATSGCGGRGGSCTPKWSPSNNLRMDMTESPRSVTRKSWLTLGRTTNRSPKFFAVEDDEDDYMDDNDYNEIENITMMNSKLADAMHEVEHPLPALHADKNLELHNRSHCNTNTIKINEEYDPFDYNVPAYSNIIDAYIQDFTFLPESDDSIPTEISYYTSHDADSTRDGNCSVDFSQLGIDSSNSSVGIDDDFEEEDIQAMNELVTDIMNEIISEHSC